MPYANEAGSGFRSRINLAKMMTIIVAECASFGLAVSEAKTENCVMTKYTDRVGNFRYQGSRSSIQAKPAMLVYIEATI